MTANNFANSLDEQMLLDKKILFAQFRELTGINCRCDCVNCVTENHDGCYYKPKCPLSSVLDGLSDLDDEGYDHGRPWNERE